MSTTASNIRHHLDTILTFLNPLLPLANCHMVEFYTQCHWMQLVPDSLRILVDKLELSNAIEKFWSGSNKLDENCALSKWIHETRSHCVSSSHDYCISKEEFQHHLVAWGGEIKPQLKVKEFMNSKKSYEVQTMSNLVASLHHTCKAKCCVEAGGGHGHLQVALSLGYAVPSLTIDCDEARIATAMKRVKIIQKQWHAISKNVRNGNEETLSGNVRRDLHRFASSFVTQHTDLEAIVRNKFPEHSQNDIKLLLTGLHTCGNLGPDSLRIFTRQPSVAALFNVPCCYHLLTEALDNELFDVFEKDYGSGNPAVDGFPMSEHLRGFNLGRNARMLAAQSVDRVVHHKQLPSKSLLYRALLQVLIKNHLPDLQLSDGKLKRLTNKCQNFEQYFKMADSTLNLKLFEKFTNDELNYFCKDIDVKWKEMAMFYLIRLCLAQVIEGVILLDRLLYLYESGFEKVYLIKLFDPILSPRCHSIVAVR